MNQKSKDCGLDEDVECPWISEEWPCPGESCPGHKAYNPTDYEERFKAMSQIGYGRK